MKRKLRGVAVNSLTRTPLEVAVDHVDAIYSQGQVDPAVADAMCERIKGLVAKDRSTDLTDFIKGHKGGDDYKIRDRYLLHKMTAEAARDGDPAQLVLAQRAADIKAAHPVECADPSKAQQELTALLNRAMRRDNNSSQPA